jgi:hypothetical protein
MSGYYSSGKKGEFERRASLAHAPIFLWQDGWDKNKLYTQVRNEIIVNMAKATNTLALDIKKDFIYASQDGASYRFSQRVAEQCAIYVRQAFLQRKYEGGKAALSKDWQRRKKKLMGKFPHAAKKQDHMGVLYGNMARAIQAFRTNIRSAGEKNHTGYVVGIPMTLGAIDLTPGPDGRVKKAKLFLKNSKITKNKTKAKSRKVLLHDKLSWFEHGKKDQPARRIYSEAVKGFLKEMGFIPNDGPDVVTRPGTHKTRTRKGSRAEELTEDMIREKMLRSQLKLFKERKAFRKK